MRKKVLALVELNESGEIISKVPELVAMDNTSKEAVLKFAEDAKEAFKYQKERKDRKITFEEMRKLGFIHRSDLEPLMEAKYIEMETRMTVKYRYEKLIEKNWATLWKQVSGVGIKIYSYVKRKKNGAI